ncbi:hypothetical protein AVEN_74048-1 [Araneus ventricosus]|uniref:Uncharacterized protein n=1 Tax=Araneus ventricosus TaxID=182803 RepID=A0A4Y2SJJ1_ARAVE|nr:hypothetical protein AVEN_74048-1 [Araneus ventricosus]
MESSFDPDSILSLPDRASHSIQTACYRYQIERVIRSRQHTIVTRSSEPFDPGSMLLLPDRALVVKLFYKNGESATIELRMFRTEEGLKS